LETIQSELIFSEIKNIFYFLILLLPGAIEQIFQKRVCLIFEEFDSMRFLHFVWEICCVLPYLSIENNFFEQILVIIFNRMIRQENDEVSIYSFLYPSNKLIQMNFIFK
jgi:hypothetical protein